MIKATTNNTIYTINPSVTYLTTLEGNLSKLQAFTNNNSLSDAHALISSEKGFHLVTLDEVDDALFGTGEVRGRKGLITSITQSLSSEGNPDRPAKIEMTSTEVEGIYQDAEGNTYVKGLVVSEVQTEFVPMGKVNRIKRLISEKLSLAKWVSVKVEQVEVI